MHALAIGDEVVSIAIIWSVACGGKHKIRVAFEVGDEEGDVRRVVEEHVVVENHDELGGGMANEEIAAGREARCLGSLA